MSRLEMKALAVTATLAALSGCGAIETRSFVHKASDDNANTIIAKEQELRQGDAQVLEVVREIDGVWLGRKTIKVSRDAELPAIFSQLISFQFPDRPSLTVIGDRISKITGFNVRVSPDALVPIEQFYQQRNGGATAPAARTSGSGIASANGMPLPGTPGTPVQGMFPVASGPLGSVPSMIANENVPLRPFILDLSSPFSESVKDLLDQLSARYGVGWDFKDGTILISRMVTRTYQIASLIDTNETKTSVSKSGSTSTSGGGSSGGMTQAGSASSSSDVSSSVSSRVDVVEGLKESIAATLTPNVGKFSISSFGVVTVTDTREVQGQISELIDAENKAIGRQVRLNLVMVEVEASTKNDTAFDWTWAIAQATRKWNVDFSAPPGMLGGGGQNSGQLGLIRNGSNSTTSVLLKALGEVGRVSLKKNETYTMMNNRPLAVSQVDNFIYPARSTPSNGAVAGAAAGAAGVEPGQLTTGNFLNLRASVQPNGSVIVLFSLDSTRKGTVETFNSNGSVLQYPQSSGGNYQTYASIPNGQTGIIAAIDSSSSEAKDRSFDTSVSPLLGGGLYNNVTVKKTLLLLTPVVIEGAS